MTHDPLCRGTSGSFCDCPLIAKVREDERSRWHTPWMNEDWQRGYRQGANDMNEKAASAIEDYDKEHHKKHDIRMPCIRCDISAAYRNAISIVRGVRG